ncbi:EF-hand domain-containing protein [Sphingomonas donggukensis]|uniref:EF-hand domain-containing protein n=1 Tax=Sphingomonas donggukensis TaxID=2949093 RepID=A0ABY4TWN8_9SPHN|nr:EF-hand domain-containing protein [Sphingomonas donggukensis]URW76811.1 EF-hand domain-containing protein [Sphingomonas donggukensis]
MLRYLAGVVSALLLVAAGVFVYRSSATAEAPATPMPRQAFAAEVQEGAAPVEEEPLPQASALTREQKRFNRVDKDRSGVIARDEYLAPRRKAFAKLDVNGDGRLSFDEWAIKTTTKFAGADRDKSGTLTPAEFATTAVKRSPRARLRCPPQQAPNEAD